MTRAGAPGYGYDGGFADKIVVDQITLVRMPDNVPFALGAAGTDAGMTSHHAVIAKGRVTAGTRLGIIGLGGLGQIGARVGVLAGAEVYVAEIDEEVWDLAHDLGATGVARSIRGFADRQLDVIVDFAGFGTTTAEAIEAVRFGGRVVQVGMGKLEATISTRDLIIKECELVGCRGGTSDDIAGVYELFATGQLAPHYTEIGFDDIPDGLDRLARGEVKGRLVARINDAR
jgi:propanol-preferring alcohol dehydrogenase